VRDVVVTVSVEVPPGAVMVPGLREAERGDTITAFNVNVPEKCPRTFTVITLVF
jgi:hypothetical protein